MQEVLQRAQKAAVVYDRHGCCYLAFFPPYAAAPPLRQRVGLTRVGIALANFCIFACAVAAHVVPYCSTPTGMEAWYLWARVWYNGGELPYIDMREDVVILRVAAAVAAVAGFVAFVVSTALPGMWTAAEAVRVAAAEDNAYLQRAYDQQNALWQNTTETTTMAAAAVTDGETGEGIGRAGEERERLLPSSARAAFSIRTTTTIATAPTAIPKLATAPSHRFDASMPAPLEVAERRRVSRANTVARVALVCGGCAALSGLVALSAAVVDCRAVRWREEEAARPAVGCACLLTACISGLLSVGVLVRHPQKTRLAPLCRAVVLPECRYREVSEDVLAAAVAMAAGQEGRKVTTVHPTSLGEPHRCEEWGSGGGGAEALHGAQSPTTRATLGVQPLPSAAEVACVAGVENSRAAAPPLNGPWGMGGGTATAGTSAITPSGLDRVILRAKRR